MFMQFIFIITKYFFFSLAVVLIMCKVRFLKHHPTKLGIFELGCYLDSPRYIYLLITLKLILFYTHFAAKECVNVIYSVKPN